MGEYKDVLIKRFIETVRKEIYKYNGGKL